MHRVNMTSTYENFVARANGAGRAEDLPVEEEVEVKPRGGFRGLLARFVAKRNETRSRDSSSPDEEDKLKAETDEERDESKNEEVEDAQTISLKTHSTPTSGFDDGYGSCNSSPHGSGKFIRNSFNVHNIQDITNHPNQAFLRNRYILKVKEKRRENHFHNFLYT